MAHDKKSETTESTNLDRRNFMKTTGRAAGGLVGGSLLGVSLAGQAADADTPEPLEEPEHPHFQEARHFFTSMDDFEVLKAATERIFPEDDNGPGAIGLNVPYYIDKQLAGLWGINGRDYRDGPFSPQTREDLEVSGASPHPENSALNRGAIFINGLHKLDEESRKRFDKPFDSASGDQQDEILKDFEDDKVEMVGVTASNFFELLRQGTLEGAYCDPSYGGNKDMEGWKMKEFPGSQPSYEGYIDKDEFVKLEPISLSGYQKQSE